MEYEIIIIIIFFVIFISIQYTLNKIYRELKELKRIVRFKSDKE